MEAAFRRANEAALDVSNHELDTFCYSVSHELRTPLTSINGLSALLAKKLTGSKDAVVLHYVDRIQSGTVQMGRLIENLLTLAHVVRVPMQLSLVDLSALANSICEKLQVRQPDRQVSIQIGTGLQTLGDAGLLRIMLESLLHNAWKFSEQKATIQIRVAQQTNTGGIPVFFVMDKGMGFDMVYAQKLFKPFERLHEGSDLNVDSGIGLAVASRVILRHGGRIWAESEPDSGATFFFTLPSIRPAT